MSCSYFTKVIIAPADPFNVALIIAAATILAPIAADATVAAVLTVSPIISVV